MAPKIFLTGATGFIGGDALYALSQSHPEYEFTLLVRNEERGALVAAAYPNARLVYGTLDDAEVIEKAAAEADVVVHTADSADNQPSARAIAKGLSAGHTAAKPGYWIHVCGTGLLTWYDRAHARYGQAPLASQRYHDIEDVSRITTLPHEAAHRPVDEIVLAANTLPGGGVRTLIVGPPTIYGTGRGPGNARSVQVPKLIGRTLQDGAAPVLAPGLTEWDHVYIADLGRFFVLAVEAALDPARNGNPEIFGPRAYFFAESGAHRWSDVATWIAEEAAKQGLLPEAKTKEFSDPAQLGIHSLGLNSKSVAARARKYLGWEPSSDSPSLKDEMPSAVAIEAKRLGKA
ncbi:NAD(P)-binding protein [Whalleya microplaca]|nr:NAD(P)-binding protein [Whalleya microplaca]